MHAGDDVKKVKKKNLDTSQCQRRRQKGNERTPEIRSLKVAWSLPIFVCVCVCVCVCVRACECSGMHVALTSVECQQCFRTKTAHQQTHQSLFTPANPLSSVFIRQMKPAPLISITVLFACNISASIMTVIMTVIQARLLT